MNQDFEHVLAQAKENAAELTLQAATAQLHYEKLVAQARENTDKLKRLANTAQCHYEKLRDRQNKSSEPSRNSEARLDQGSFNSGRDSFSKGYVWPHKKTKARTFVANVETCQSDDYTGGTYKAAQRVMDSTGAASVSFHIEPTVNPRAALLRDPRTSVRITTSSGRVRGNKASPSGFEASSQRHGKECVHCRSTTHSLKDCIKAPMAIFPVASFATP
jgi:hypothetical protein